VEEVARQEEAFVEEQDARDAGRLPDIVPPAPEDYLDFDDDCAPVLADVLGDRPLEPDAEPAPAPLSALFPMDLLARELSPGSADGPPFPKGSPLDVAPPGAVLADAVERFCTTGAGVAGMSDDQLAGVMQAVARLQARAAAQLTLAVSELAHRRGADPDHRVGEATGTEVAITLALTRRAAGRLIGFATDLDPLPATRQALWGQGGADRLRDGAARPGAGRRGGAAGDPGCGPADHGRAAGPAAPGGAGGRPGGGAPPRGEGPPRCPGGAL
jgi:hypothetical protein